MHPSAYVFMCTQLLQSISRNLFICSYVSACGIPQKASPLAHTMVIVKHNVICTTSVGNITYALNIPKVAKSAVQYLWGVKSDCPCTFNWLHVIVLWYALVMQIEATAIFCPCSLFPSWERILYSSVENICCALFKNTWPVPYLSCLFFW